MDHRPSLVWTSRTSKTVAFTRSTSSSVPRRPDHVQRLASVLALDAAELVLDHVFVEFDPCEVRVARQKLELSRRRERWQRAQPSTSRAVPRQDLTNVHLDFVT